MARCGHTHLHDRPSLCPHFLNVYIFLQKTTGEVEEEKEALKAATKPAAAKAPEAPKAPPTPKTPPTPPTPKASAPKSESVGSRVKYLFSRCPAPFSVRQAGALAAFSLRSLWAASALAPAAIANVPSSAPLMQVSGLKKGDGPSGKKKA